MSAATLLRRAAIGLVLLSGCIGREPTIEENPSGLAMVEDDGTSPRVAAIADAVKVEVIPRYGALDADRGSELDVLVRLDGQGEGAGPRPPLDLALVLDRSGSMSGDKLRSVKEAALEMLGRLGPDDRVTLISYSDDVSVHAMRTPVDRSSLPDLRDHVLALESSGGTALGPGLFSALDALVGVDRAENVTAHVMLLSDGLANEGEQRPEVLGQRASHGFARGTSVSTLGVGLDYNEDLMTRIADQGGGRYHFIEKSDEVVRVLGDELAGLAATVARGVELDLELARGVRVVKVFGYASDGEGGRTRIRVGSLAAGQTREVVVRLEVDPGKDRRVALGRFGVRYRDVEADGETRSLAVRPEVETTRDLERVRASEQVAVTVRVAELEGAERLQLAAGAVGRGDYDDAQRLIREAVSAVQQQAAETPSPVLDGQIEELLQAEQDLQRAKTSEKERRLYQKKNKASSYTRGKGSFNRKKGK